jgi:5'(3')-deoxyribonucleotidase
VQKPTQRPTIAVDIDDVLAANAAGFAAYSKRRWGVEMTAADYDEDWPKAWGVSMEVGRQWADEYHNSEAFREYASIEHALPVLRDLKQHYRLIIVTSRRKTLQPDTLEWIDEHFPGIFEEIHFAGIWDDYDDARKALQVTKSDICKELGADYLIDDQVKHCKAAAEAGIDSLLFGDYRWNATDGVLPDNVARVTDWPQVREYFDGRRS